LVAVIILCGGMGRRVGQNKSLLQLRGKPLLAYVLTTAQELSGEIVVSIDSDQDEEAISRILPRRARIVRDILPRGGPLLGLLSGLSFVTSTHALACPCDTPFINANVIKHLVRRASGFDAVVPVWPNGYLEPLQSVYRVEAAKTAAIEAIEHGRLRLSGMIKGLPLVRFIPVDELRSFDPCLSTFFNINTPSDLERAEEMLEEREGKSPNETRGPKTSRGSLSEKSDLCDWAL